MENTRHSGGLNRDAGDGRMCAIFPKWDVGIVVPTDKSGKETTESGHSGSAGPIHVHLGRGRRAQGMRARKGSQRYNTLIFIYLTKLPGFYIQIDGWLYISILYHASQEVGAQNVIARLT